MNKYSENETLHTIESLLADLNAVCAEVQRLASYERQALYDEFANNDTVDEWMQKHRPARVAEILERWKEQQT